MKIVNKADQNRDYLEEYLACLEELVARKMEVYGKVNQKLIEWKGVRKEMTTNVGEKSRSKLGRVDSEFLAEMDGEEDYDLLG